MFIEYFLCARHGSVLDARDKSEKVDFGPQGAYICRREIHRKWRGGSENMKWLFTVKKL